MDYPPQAQRSQRRAVSSQAPSTRILQRQASIDSPTPAKGKMPVATEDCHRVRPRTGTVSIEWQDTESSSNRRTTSLQMRTECIESETITTTKVTKRTYPSLAIKEPHAIHALNIKDYPLASAPIPSQLARFSYHLNGEKNNYGNFDEGASPPEEVSAELSVTRGSM